MLPTEWKKRLVDMNVRRREDDDLLWADYVFLGAMSIQKESVKTVLDRCRRIGVKVVAGGPLFTQDREEFCGVDHLVLDEAEITLPLFLRDLKDERPRRVYTSGNKWADVSTTPIPLWDLINMKHYA